MPAPMTPNALQPSGPNAGIPWLPLSPYTPYLPAPPVAPTLLAAPYTPNPAGPLAPYTTWCPLIPLHPLLAPQHPYPQNRNLVVKSGTTAGEHDMSSASGSGCCFVRCTPTPHTPSMPPGRGIWWPRVVLTEVLLTWAHVLLPAICLVCYCHQFAIHHFHEYIQFTIYNL